LDDLCNHICVFYICCVIVINQNIDFFLIFIGDPQDFSFV